MLYILLSAVYPLYRTTNRGPHVPFHPVGRLQSTMYKQGDIVSLQECRERPDVTTHLAEKGTNKDGGPCL